MSVSSQDHSFQLFNCKWAWCRSTFSNNAELAHHVIHDHVRRAIPVRRRDISMIQRAEEGKGESLRISELMVDMYSYSSRESVSHKPGTASLTRLSMKSNAPYYFQLNTKNLRRPSHHLQLQVPHYISLIYRSLRHLQAHCA